jgi:PAX-interacting protein 1
LEEIREINQRLIETIVRISCEDDDSVAAAAEGGDGTVVKFVYSAVACSSSLKSQFASEQVVGMQTLIYTLRHLILS